MATNTTNYSLTKPAVNDPTDADRWGNQLNDDLDTIDTELYDGSYGITPYAASSGAAANTYEVTYSPAITAYTSGLTLKFKAHQVNTGAATLNVNALGAKSIVKDVSSALTSNDIKTNQIITVVYDGTNFQMQSRAATAGSVINTQGDIITGDSGGAAQRLALGAAGMSLVSDGTDAVWGFPYKNYQVFDTAGVDTFNTPTGVTKVMVACWGAGGGGGGAYTNYNALPITWILGLAGGGGGGGFAFGIYTPAATETVTIGAGGTGGTGTASPTNGSDGGTTSFGSHCSATGGKGGKAANQILSIGGLGGLGTNGFFNAKGGDGENGGTRGNHQINTGTFNAFQTNQYSGRGGYTALIGQYADGVTSAAGASSGNNGSYGGGGSGGHGGAVGGGSGDGGDGGDGLVIVFW